VCAELFWLAICAVKFSFLFFFRGLVCRQSGPIAAWWWAVTAFTIATALYTIIMSPLACPYYRDVEKLGTV
jgi:hypothetical protein